ncbi:RICIN domain-containing protein [Streptomyces morookaense]|uniref:RICIN domain-containing protein n=1 Tax=Streptomyces morookaense TaxID=1970 RepID=A0A7Y7AZQ8_STRMO|nr:RICIN domain-containing protein [Streptomyces morookaense]NVK76363.1 RICIN domain-containing protein [Streptomyces morookaense]GHF39304.1 hypothetical protein GCM10010359_47650 [Streptomyces morookaense]
MSRTIRAALAIAGSLAFLTAGATTAYADEPSAADAAAAADAAGGADLARPAQTTVQLQVAHSGKCLEINNGAADNGLQAQQWTCYDTVAAQKWRVISAGDSAFQLQNVASGKCLEVENSGTDAGAKAQQWSCFGGKNTRWQFVLVDYAKKLYQVRPTHVADRCLDIDHGKTENAAKAQQWTCNRSDAQLWKVLPVK